MIKPLDKEKVFSLIEAEKERIINFAQSLIRIPSTNHPPTGDEKECQLFIADKIKKMGLKVDIFTPDEVEKLKEHPAYLPGRDYTNRPNVVGVYKGNGGGKSLLLMAHTDVELPGAKELWDNKDPWSGEIKEGKLFGRGSGDDKSGIVAQTMALEAVMRAGYHLNGDVILCAVVDEEQGGGNGTLSCILRGYSANAAIYLDGTSEIQIANLGGSSFEITVWTKGHADIDRTLKIMKRVYQAIKDLREKRKKTFRDSSIYRNNPAVERTIWVSKFVVGGKETGGTVNIGKILCWMYMLPGEEKEEIKRLFENYFKEIAQEDEKVKFRWRGRWLLPSMISAEEEIVNTVAKAYKEVTNENPVIGGAPMCDLYLLNFYSRMPAFMSGIQRWNQEGGAHQPNEYVKINDLITYTKVIALSIMDWCGYSSIKG